MAARDRRAFWACVALVAVIAGCGRAGPTTTIVRRGSVLVGVWECTEANRAEAVLKRWLSVAPPADEPATPKYDADALESLLPKDGAVRGWERAGQPQIVERADFAMFLRRSPAEYESFGVRRVASVEYVNRTLGPKPLLRVDVYDMGTPENAFGFYSHRRVPQGSIRAIGAEAYVGSRELYAWEDRFYFYVTIYEYADETREALLHFGYEIGGRIDGVTESPSLIASLPMQDVVAWSPRWFRTLDQARTASRHAELLLLPLNERTRGFTAQFRKNDGRTAELFYIAFPSAEEAQAGYDALRDALSDGHRIRRRTLGDEGFRAQPMP